MQIIYFDNFGVEHILKELQKFMGNKNIVTNIYRIQTHDSIMLYSIMILKGKILLNYTNSFSPNDYEKNYEIILKYLQ